MPHLAQWLILYENVTFVFSVSLPSSVGLKGYSSLLFFIYVMFNVCMSEHLQSTLCRHSLRPGLLQLTDLAWRLRGQLCHGLL